MGKVEQIDDRIAKAEAALLKLKAKRARVTAPPKPSKLSKLNSKWTNVQDFALCYPYNLRSLKSPEKYQYAVQKIGQIMRRSAGACQQRADILRSEGLPFEQRKDVSKRKARAANVKALHTPEPPVPTGEPTQSELSLASTGTGGQA